LRYFKEAEFKFMTKIFAGKDTGLTLVEALVAMTVFLITLAFMIPLLANNQFNIIREETRTGAISVSQRILDELRQTDIANLPSSGTMTELPSGTDISATTNDGKTYMTELGKTYSAKIIYCETSTNCSANARQIKLQVNYNGQTIYTVETVYTRLQ